MQTWLVTIGIIVSLFVQVCQLIVAWWVISTNQKLSDERHKMLLEANEATWSEVVEIKRHLGLVNGGAPRYVTTERVKMMEDRDVDASKRLDKHSERLRDIEIRLSAAGD